MATAKEVEDLPRLVEWRNRGKHVQVNLGGNLQKSMFTMHSEGFGGFSSPKPRLVLIHGYPTASFDFRRIVPELEKHFDIFTWDFLGYGFSEKDYADVQTQVDIFELILKKEFGATKDARISFHVLSHDLGDTIMQEMCARIVGKVVRNFEIESVVALNGGMLPGIHRPTLMQNLLLNSWVGPFISMFVTIGVFQRSISKVFGPDTQPSDLEIEELYALVNCNGGDKLFAENIKYMEDRVKNKTRYVNALKRFSQKNGILLINGPFDPVSGRHLGTAVQEQIPNANVIFLADAIGHWPQLEDPQGVLTHFFQYHVDRETEGVSKVPDSFDIPE